MYIQPRKKERQMSCRKRWMVVLHRLWHASSICFSIRNKIVLTCCAPTGFSLPVFPALASTPAIIAICEQSIELFKVQMFLESVAQAQNAQDDENGHQAQPERLFHHALGQRLEWDVFDTPFTTGTYWRFVSLEGTKSFQMYCKKGLKVTNLLTLARLNYPPAPKNFSKQIRHL